MAVNDIYRLAISGTPNDIDEFVNVVHYRQTVDASPAMAGAEALSSAWLDDALPAYQAIMYEGFAFKLISIKETPGPGEEFEQALTSFGTGASSGEFLPYQNAAVISWRTGVAGRSKRGRTFLFPALEGDQVGGNLSSGYITLMDSIGTDWLEVTHGVNGATFELVIWSPTLNSAQTVITSISQGLLGTQRSRRPGSGS